MNQRFKETINNRFNKQKSRVKRIFKETKSIFCPYFEDKVVFNSDGFYHLRYSCRRERKKEEQLLKFELFPLAIKIIKKSGTLQEYRTDFIKVGKKSKDGLFSVKRIEYWGFEAICGNNKDIKVRVILRRIGDGNIIFWSIMPCGDLKNLKLYKIGIEDG